MQGQGHANISLILPILMEKYLFCFAALLLVFASPMFAQALPTINALDVEILIYSGRPNPKFTVTDPAEIREIMGLVTGLPQPSSSATKGAETPSGGLGYQGIVVRNRSKVGAEVQSFTTRRSAVQLVRGGTPAITTSAAGAAAQPAAPEARVDSSSAIERRLLTLAQTRGVIDNVVLAHINSVK